jgi:hypothetical protein
MNAQGRRWKRYRYEIFYGIGAANLLGELGGADQIGSDYLKDLEIKLTRPGLHMGMKYRTTQLTAVRFSITAGLLKGDDQTTNELYRMARNIHFTSPIVETALTYEVMLLKERSGHRYSLRGVRGIKRLELYPYLFFGVGGFWFNPRAQYTDGKRYSLRSYNTEGQGQIPSRKEYSPFQVAIPVGLGFRYAVDRRWLIGFEFGIRKTFTDYLDDVSKTYVNPQYLNSGIPDDKAIYFANPSTIEGVPDELINQGVYIGALPGQQRGDPTDFDSYMFLTISVNYKLKASRSGLPKFGR